MCSAVAVYVEITYSLYYVTSDESKAIYTQCSMRGLNGTFQTQKMHQALGSFIRRTIFDEFNTALFKLSLDNNYQHLIKLARR